MKILITGTAGFIGFHLVKRMLNTEHQIVGLDSINHYYDVELKYSRLEETGIEKSRIIENKLVKSSKAENYSFIKSKLENYDILKELFEKYDFDLVINLAAQAGVRFSLTNPFSYINSNIVGFTNVIECCRHNTSVKQLIYASSSSVYGKNEKIPFSEDDRVDSPVSLYAATKRTNELIANVYSELYKLPTIGLRFFTVYGPWGRPDMAPWLFTDAIINNRPIKVFNNGKLSRDFTYIDDIIDGILLCVENLETNNKAKVYNIGCGNPVKLMDFIEEIERKLGKVAIKEFVGMQKGDVYKTNADLTRIKNDLKYQSQTRLREGISNHIDWFIKYLDDAKR